MNDKELMQEIGCSEKELEMFRAVQKKALKEAQEYNKKFFSKSLNILGISGSRRREDDCPKEDSTSEWLLKSALENAKKLGAKTELIKLRDYEILPCKECYSTTNAQCHFYCSCYPKGKYGDDMTNKLYDKCLWADAIIFATPVNNFKISSYMSLFIDRLISLDGSLTPANPNYAKDKELNIKHTKFIELTADEKIGSGFLRRFAGKTAGIIASGHEAGASMAISSLYMTLTHFGMLFPPFSNMYAMGDVCRGTYSDKENLRIDCYKKWAEEIAENIITGVKISKQNKKLFWKYDQSTN